MARPDINAACHGRRINIEASHIYQDAFCFHNDLSVYDAHGGTLVSTEEVAGLLKLWGLRIEVSFCAITNYYIWCNY